MSEKERFFAWVHDSFRDDLPLCLKPIVQYPVPTEHYPRAVGLMEEYLWDAAESLMRYAFDRMDSSHREVLSLEAMIYGYEKISTTVFHLGEDLNSEFFSIINTVIMKTR